MRKTMAGGVICLAACMALAASMSLAQSQGKTPTAAELTPLNVKPGLWQATGTVKITGLPPQMASLANTRISMKTCLTPEQVRNAREEAAKEMGGYKCASLTVLKSSASDLDVQGKGCDAGHGATADGHFKVHASDPEHATETMDMTTSGNSPIGGGSMSVHSHGDIVDTWIGASCPPDVR